MPALIGVASLPPLASLPMYDWPEVARATDSLWSGIAGHLRANGIEAPDHLERSYGTDELWRDRGLLLSQTCGFPLSTRLRGLVRLVGTPIYDVEGCEGGSYSSVIVARRDASGEDLADFAGRVFAFNAIDSLSGYVALCAALAEAGLHPERLTWAETGAHRASVRAVAEGRADVAAIDAVCWSLAERYEPEACAALRVVARTPLRPGLPLVTAAGRSDAEAARIGAAIRDALSDPATGEARSVLRISGLTCFDAADYAPIGDLARHAPKLRG